MNNQSRALSQQYFRGLGALCMALLLMLGGSNPLYADYGDDSSITCKVGGDVKRVVKVNMVALNQAFYFNRLGAAELNGLIFALTSDVVLTSDGSPLMSDANWISGDYSGLPGKVALRPDKRPRPIVLRANVGDCLDITFTNLIHSSSSPAKPVTTEWASVHIEGTEAFSTREDNAAAIANMGTFTGKNPNGLTAPGARNHYSLYVPAEGAYVLYSGADNFSNFLAGQQTYGLFGSLNVQPTNAEYYRSQVSEADLAAASSGTTSTGQPKVNYQATYKSGTSKGNPILNMLKKLDSDNTYELVYTDPTAIITGPNAGEFPNNPFPVQQYPDREQPYREFNIMYHEQTQGTQAFAEFRKGNLANTLNAGGDFFAINYGSAAIGPEIWSNRIGVGPMYDCVTCQYEEFFLSSWAVGDPAMVVDIPANFTSTTPGGSVPGTPPTDTPSPGPKATKAYYPDDPSNVYHSYMRDHVKMRIHHGAGTLHHLHHLHAHQWLHSPNNDNSHYLDSQLIGPGSSFTLDMVYHGSGNRNHTVGDSIFHCHFYPHFAEGMWSIWRVHDVFESGTKLDSGGQPMPGSRALPDGEIVAGTPIPGLVPLPTIAMAPMPSDVFIEGGQVVYGTPSSPDRDGSLVTKNPGYPFFIPGIAGERVPHPPMDFAEIDGQPLDGGLPRHVVKPMSTPGYEELTLVEYHNRFDFSKFADTFVGVILPEQGTNVEQVAMRAHAIREHPSTTPEGKKADFILNGLPPQKGAPYADPCMLDNGDPAVGSMRRYRGIDIQMDVQLNKDGWHYSQQRMGVLWQDLVPTLNRERAPEPLFFRANSEDCIEYWLANVVPEYYELDDFQVRTPTDVLGQHIHLVKFDVTSSDGGANGWNYEDGTFSNETVQTRIDALNKGSFTNYDSTTQTKALLQATAPTWLCNGLTGGTKVECLRRAQTEWLGAQATVQRWYADPQLNNTGDDRTLRTVFTHDHFSPSTHQQAGLYMGLLVEPKGSKWSDSETGAKLNTRIDGGPTTWQAIIDTGNENTYREFMLEFQDFQLAYMVDSPKSSDKYVAYPDENKTTYYGRSKSEYQQINEPALNDANNPMNPDYLSLIRTLTNSYSGFLSPDHAINPPQDQNGNPVTPTLVSTTPPFALGTYSVNYRNEPTPLRIWDSNNGKQAVGEKGDLAHVFRSIARADSHMNRQPTVVPPLTAGVYPYDPYTPLMRAYEGDKVQVRTLVGAHINMHNFSMQGLRWLFEPDNTSSGYRSNQPMGISEHFEMLFQVPPTTVKPVTFQTGGGTPTNRAACVYPSSPVKFGDRLYNPTSEYNGLANGNWGIFRTYAVDQNGLCLQSLPNNKLTTSPDPEVCPLGAPSRVYNVTAVTADKLTWKNVKGNTGYGIAYNFQANIFDEKGMAYFACDATNDSSCTPHIPQQTQSPLKKLEPMVLRAAAGECITVNLTNKFSQSAAPFSTPLPVGNKKNQNAMLQFNQTFTASSEVGLAPQLVSQNANGGTGVTAGFNQVKTAKIGDTVSYTWYAGIREIQSGGTVVYTPAEFGSANLLPADLLAQGQYGMLAGMVIEPADSTWDTSDTGTSNVITLSSGDKFKEFVLMSQDTYAFTGFMDGFNYGAEPIGKETFGGRYISTTDVNVGCAYSNALGDISNPSTMLGNPETVVFQADPGDAVRFRVMQPSGADQHVFELHGHVWQEEPFTKGSLAMGDNKTSQWQGSRMGLSSMDRFDILIDSAGGTFKVPGDYLLRSYPGGDQNYGQWGIFRVGTPDGLSSQPGICKPPNYTASNG